MKSNYWILTTGLIICMSASQAFAQDVVTRIYSNQLAGSTTGKQKNGILSFVVAEHAPLGRGGLRLEAPKKGSSVFLCVNPNLVKKTKLSNFTEMSFSALTGVPSARAVGPYFGFHGQFKKAGKKHLIRMYYITGANIDLREGVWKDIQVLQPESKILVSIDGKKGKDKTLQKIMDQYPNIEIQSVCVSNAFQTNYGNQDVTVDNIRLQKKDSSSTQVLDFEPSSQ